MVRILDTEVHLEYALDTLKAEGPTAEFLSFIRQSPVNDLIGGFAGNLGAAGSGKLQLKLDLPLVIHTRDAAAETIALLKEKGVRRAVSREVQLHFHRVVVGGGARG